MEVARGDLFFQRAMHFLGAFGRAASFRIIVRAAIDADKKISLALWHAGTVVAVVGAVNTAPKSSRRLDEKATADSPVGMRKNIFRLTLFAQLVLIVSLTGCDKKSGEALVLEKEHIAAREVSEAPSPAAAAAPDATPEYKPIGADEIVVDGYVMHPEVRGTSRDPRAMDHEQWIVKVRIIADGRQFNIHADQPQWEKVKEGDRIMVSYNVGKYTKTVWGAEIR
jgi:hypothetical protein